MFIDMLKYICLNKLEWVTNPIKYLVVSYAGLICK